MSLNSSKTGSSVATPTNTMNRAIDFILSLASASLVGVVTSHFGDTRQVFFVILILCAIIFILLRTIRVIRTGDKKAYSVHVKASLSAIIVAVVLDSPVSWEGSEDEPAVVLSSSPSPTNSLVPTTNPSPETSTSNDRVVSASDGCPSANAGGPQESIVAVEVLYWCTAPVYDETGLDINPDMMYVKIRPGLRNESSDPLSISIDNPSSLRLLVRGEDLDDHWTPPSRTAEGNDRPVKIQYDGEELWAVPPNLPDQWFPSTERGDFLGHNTHWDREELAPGEELRRLKDASGTKETNLIFTIPVLDPNDLGLCGLAVLDMSSRDVIGFEHINDWPEPVQPGSF